MRPIENESSGYIIEVIEGINGSINGSYEAFPFRFKTCWLCHIPIILVYMCSECWQKASTKVKISAQEALTEARNTGSRTIYQFSPTSYKVGGRHGRT